jgi:hypothetical protein
MLTKAEIFKQKINFIFNKVCNKDLDKFTHLFWIEDGKTTFENRKYNLNQNWIKKATISKNFPKEYDLYSFSSKNIHGKKLFKDADDFLSTELKDFKKIIQSYVDYQNTVIVPKDLNYKYLYNFSCNIEDDARIDCYYIEHLNSDNTETNIMVTPPKNKTSFKIKPYEGTLKLQKNKIILTFSNSEDYISAIFNLELANRHTKHLVGVGIGISDINEKIPVSKKVILTKEPVEDINELYLTLNETEIISAKENSFKFQDDSKNPMNSHLEKYIKKIARLDSLFKRLSKEGHFTSFYEQLAFKEFSAIHNLFQKFQKHHSFYIHYRKRILDILIESHKNEPYKKLSMVMPIYKEDNLFEQQSDNAIELQNALKELSKSVEIKIVFVVKDCNKPVKQEFITFLKEVSSLMKIHFVFKDKIEYEVNSVDFFFTGKDDFVISKELRTDISAFQLYKHKNTIDIYHAFFRTILNRSISYEEFMQDKNFICIKENPLLKNLSGKWYHYIYGSKKFWEDKVTIFEDGRVEYFCEEKTTERGNIIIKEYQSVMLLDDPTTKRLFTIIFDNQPYKIQKAFFTKNIAKQFETDLDIFSIGILSRKPIPIDKAIEILGDIDDVRFLEKSIMSQNLANYLTDNYGYQHTHKK